jgi:hypothetical protein
VYNNLESLLFFYPAETVPGEIQFDVNMSVEELCGLLKQKGVDDDDCALFRSKVHCWVKGRQNLPNFGPSQRAR